MAEHFWLTALPAIVIALWWFRPRRPIRRVELTPLEQATLRSMANRLSTTRQRMAQLVQENEELARELARVGRLKDRAQLEVEELKDKQLAERDELIQRLGHCVCTVGPALVAEMEEDERG